jgi:hypothetical protein
MQENINKQIVELHPITTIRDKKGFRFYSTDDGNTLYAEKNGKIYNVSSDSLNVLSEVFFFKGKEKEFVGIINDEDIKDLHPLHYEYTAMDRTRKKFSMAKGGELSIGDKVTIDNNYGGGSGVVSDIYGSFIVVETKDGKQSFHESNLSLENDDYEDEDDYAKGGELESKKQNLLEFLNFFPNDAKSWGQATDELRDLARMARITYLEVDDKEFEPLDFKTLKTPSEWNTKGKLYIFDMYLRMSDEAKKEFLDAFEQTFDTKMAHGGKTRDSKILFTVNDEKIDDLLRNSNLNYEFMDDDGYLMSFSDYEKFKVMVSDKGYDENKIFVSEYDYANGGEIPTITKEEWSKKQKDSKLKTEDGKYYIMKYDDKIGTYLQQVKVLKNGSFVENTYEVFYYDADGEKHISKPIKANSEEEAISKFENDSPQLDVSYAKKIMAYGGMIPGRYYKDNKGEEYRFVGESRGKLLFKDGEKVIEKSENDFEDDYPKESKLFGFFEKGGELSTFAQANKIAEDRFGEFGIGTLDEDDLSKIINISKANKLAKKYGEDSFITLEESDMETILNQNPDLLKKSMAKGGEVNEEEIIDKLEEQFRGKDLWEDEILDEYEVKMFDFEEFNDEETFNKWKNKNSKKNYIVPFESDDDSYIFILVPKNKMEEGGEVSKAGELKSKIEKILDKVLPGFYKNVFVRKNYFDKGESIGIIMAASNYEINRVKGQYPQDVSLMLDVEEMDLNVQVFGGNGGNRIYLIPDKNDPKEKYLAMAGVKIPFRTPKKEEKFVLQAIEKFAENYKKALKENKDRLMYKEYVDYDTLIMAKGGMTEHGLKIGDKIIDNVFWNNQIVVENTKTNKKAVIDLETGKRKDSMAKGGETELVQDPKTKEFTRRMKMKPEDIETVKKIQDMMAKEKSNFQAKNKMRKGGEATFEDKVKAVQKNLLKKKKVPAVVQKDYGKTYNKEEAKESAQRIIGSQTAKWRQKNSMAKGGKTSVSPLKDRIFGSKKNKTGTASSKTSAKDIELNDSIVEALSEKAKKYNEKHSNKVSVSTLKAVMRRGMGAFSSSHRPGMTRQGWGYARVNKFLLKKGGSKVKAAYTQDDDLL